MWRTTADVLRRAKAVTALAMTLTIALMSAAPMLRAQGAYEFDFPPQALDSALRALGHKTSTNILFEAAAVQNLQAPALRAQLTADEAVKQMLAGTALHGQRTSADTIVIRQVRPGDKQSAAAAAGAGAVGMQLAQTEAQMEEKASASAVEASRVTVQEIVVTAQKRAEKLQDVPFSISALDTKALERSGATSAEQYLALVPGVQYNSFGRGRSPIIIRGVATESAVSALQPTSERYIDDLPLTDRYGAWTSPDPNTFDMERVEVLRGPQGTLFGSGALGGVVRLITNKPNLDRLQTKLEVGVASTEHGADGNTVNAMVNVPLVQDKLAIRLVGWRVRDGGYIDDIRNGRDDINDALTTGARVMLGYQPSEATHIRLTAYYDEEDLGAAANSFRFAADGGPYDFDPYQAEFSEAQMQLYNATIEHDFGPLSLTSTTTYGLRDGYLFNDWAPLFAGSAVTPDNETSFTRNSKRLAQELRLASNGEGPLEWTLGGFFLDYKLTGGQIWSAGGGGPALPVETLFLRNSLHYDLSEVAVFGEATYHLNPRLSATVGGRWFHNKLHHLEIGEGLFGSNADARATNEAVTPKFSISYYPQDDVHLYATAAKGYRIGQVNFNYITYPAIPQGYGPDSLWNYEVGMKSSWFDHRLQSNIAAYFIDWSDIQLLKAVCDQNGVCLFNSNHYVNAGRATIKGIEAEIVARLSNSIEMGSSLSYNDGKMKSVDFGTGIKVGSRLPGTPEFAATNYVQYQRQVGQDINAYLRLIHRYTGKTYASINNDWPYIASDAYNKFDLRSGVLFGNYELSLYVENLANSDAIATAGGLISSGSGFVSVGDFGPFNNAPVNRLRPRTIGVTFRAEF